MNPALIAKALKVKEYLAKNPIKPTDIFETVQKNPDGTAIYIFEGKFKTVKEAEMFKALAGLNAEVESWLNE